MESRQDSHDKHRFESFYQVSLSISDSFLSPPIQKLRVLNFGWLFGCHIEKIEKPSSGRPNSGRSRLIDVAG